MLCRGSASCDKDVGDVGADDVEELFDRPGTTKGTEFAVLQSIFLPIFDELWLLTTSPMVSIPVIFAEFSDAGVSSRSMTVTNKSTSLTYTVACSFVSTSPLAVTTVVGFFSDSCGFQFCRVMVFPADHMRACSGIHHELSFLQFCCGWGWQTPLIGR